jgi:acyl-homoserine lactone acylase PvdQ
MKYRAARRRSRAKLIATTLAPLALLGPLTGLSATAQMPAGQDPAQGQTLSILPAGANGLVNVGQLVAFETQGQRPPNSQDQYRAYENLPYDSTLNEGSLANYYHPETFTLPADQVTRAEQPDPTIPVVIQWDTYGVPHINGDSTAAAAYGVGYAQAENRLFQMDVLRHFGSATLSSFVGPSCSDEAMDQQSLLYGAATPAQQQAELDALPAEYPQDNLGQQVVQLLGNYVAGVNAYIDATRSNINLLPADYLAIGKLPVHWVPTDVVAIASLIGGQLGSGGGNALQNAGLLEYLQGRYGAAVAGQIFTAFKEQNDPGAPSTITDRSFPYMQPGQVDPNLNVLPDHAFAALSGAPTATTPGCDISASNPSGLINDLAPYLGTLPAQTSALLLGSMPMIQSRVGDLMRSLAGGLNFPRTDSNALVVDGAHTTTGHPIAVFGPQVAYWAPEILTQEVVQAPGLMAEGVSFPGTGLVELGRGLDYAWSATSAGTQNIDTQVVSVCNPSGGAPGAQGTDYTLDGVCVPMRKETFTETATPTPGGLGLPVVLNHDIYVAAGGIVQGWTTVNGQPVAIIQKRSNYLHDIDSAVAFLRLDSPKYTSDVHSWMEAVSQINFTFNWFYVDTKDAGYYVSGWDPVRPGNVDPNLPAVASSATAWPGLLPTDAHPHEVNPPQGYFVSWNNKPAPDFSANDVQFGYGPVYRSQMLTKNLQFELWVNGGHVDRSQVAIAMASAATQDLSGLVAWPALQSAIGVPSDSKSAELLQILDNWVAKGAHRIQAVPGQGEYTDAAAVAISDELFPRLVVNLFGPIFAGSGISTSGGTANGFNAFPQMEFVNAPGKLGSAYDGGWEGNVQKLLDQLAGVPVAQPFPISVLDHVCGANGVVDCPQAIAAALSDTWDALVKANGGSTTPPSWTADSASSAAGRSIPSLDQIQFTTVGIVGQPAMPWQNRPTFQQVAEFPQSRPPG